MKMKTRLTEDRRLCFWCPGCQEVHAVYLDRWQWNGNRDFPTLTPSILVRSGHYASGDSSSCWCTYNAAHPDDPAPFVCSVCHSFVTDGKIIFLVDSTHSYAGKTVELEAHFEDSEAKGG